MPGPAILVVDDFPSGRALLDAILSAAGYEVVTANDGQEALRSVARRRPDLIFLDIEMPVMDGYAACRVLKENPETATIPVLMVTGLDDAEHIRAALRHGADGYIMKPLDTAEVQAKVPQMLELAKAGKLPGRFYLKGGGPPAG
jgi:CheY-like chemotaxis protein